MAYKVPGRLRNGVWCPALPVISAAASVDPGVGLPVGWVAAAAGW
jgi:hypothetical protein